MNVLHRPASVDDADAIASLHASSWRRSYRGAFRDEFLDGPIDEERRATWHARLSSGNEQQLVLVSVVRDRIEGFVCAYAHGDDGWGVFVDNLHVAAAFQGSGLGTGLLRSVAAWASARGRTSPPYLWVLEPNVKAQRFYERRGARQREAVVRENPGGGTAVYLRYAWASDLEMAAGCRERSRSRP